MASNSVDLFKRFGIPDCPISHGSVTDPLFADCNEAQIRTDLMDQICKKIFEVKQETGKDPIWYTENGIRFSKAMEALKIDPKIRERIGPDAPSYRRLLTSEGTFNEEGLHLFEKDLLINWLYRGQSAHCPQCIQPCSTAFSKAYYCFVKYQNPDIYLTDKDIEKTFQTEKQRRQGINRSLSVTHTIHRIFHTIEAGTQNYLIPLAIFTVNIWYFLIACDTIFATNLTSKFAEMYDKTHHIHSKITIGLEYSEYAQMAWTFFRTGGIAGNDALSVYVGLLNSHLFFIPKAVPSHYLVQVVAVYYAAQKIGKMVLPAQVLNYRYIERFRTMQTAALDHVSNLSLRIDAFVQRQIKHWLIPFVLYSFRFAHYTYVFYLATSLLKSDLAEEIVLDLHILTIALMNSVHQRIVPFMNGWEAMKVLFLMLSSGGIRPLVGNNYFAYRSLFRLVVFFTQRSYIIRGFACYAVMRDICWLLKIPNPICYVPYLRNWESSPLLNL